MQSIKRSTLLTGLPVSKNPHIILTSLYKRIIKVLALMPEESSYRRHTNEIVQSRLNAVQKISDIPTLESTIDCGQIEEVIIQNTISTPYQDFLIALAELGTMDQNSLSRF
ncbi:unnamed protein product [Schistosoma margrebowiei]|uniref:Uncharacterized protein n=1 Tax=Schistosoma margrebowiei TaxID=48269 RepID=A0AA85A7Z5_9TREM|nr:unnamed protein product [Schistosoma margrebowiei]